MCSIVPVVVASSLFCRRCQLSRRSFNVASNASSMRHVGIHTCIQSCQLVIGLLRTDVNARSEQGKRFTTAIGKNDLGAEIRGNVQ